MITSLIIILILFNHTTCQVYRCKQIGTGFSRRACAPTTTTVKPTTTTKAPTTKTTTVKPTTSTTTKAPTTSTTTVKPTTSTTTKAPTTSTTTKAPTTSTTTKAPTTSTTTKAPTTSTTTVKPTTSTTTAKPTTTTTKAPTTSTTTKKPTTSTTIKVPTTSNTSTVSPATNTTTVPATTSTTTVSPATNTTTVSPTTSNTTVTPTTSNTITTPTISTTTNARTTTIYKKHPHKTKSTKQNNLITSSPPDNSTDQTYDYVELSTEEVNSTEELTEHWSTNTENPEWKNSDETAFSEVTSSEDTSTAFNTATTQLDETTTVGQHSTTIHTLSEPPTSARNKSTSKTIIPEHSRPTVKNTLSQKNTTLSSSTTPEVNASSTSPRRYPSTSEKTSTSTTTTINDSTETGTVTPHQLTKGENISTTTENTTEETTTITENAAEEASTTTDETSTVTENAEEEISTTTENTAEEASTTTENTTDETSTVTENAEEETSTTTTTENTTLTGGSISTANSTVITTSTGAISTTSETPTPAPRMSTKPTKDIPLSNTDEVTTSYSTRISPSVSNTNKTKPSSINSTTQSAVDETTTFTSTDDISTSSPIVSTTKRTTTEPPSECLLPCLDGYHEGAEFCYIEVPAKNIRKYTLALAYCHQIPDADMIDEYDIMRNVNLFKKLNDLLGHKLYFLNEYGSKSIKQDKIVRLVDFNEATRFYVPVNKTVSIDAEISNVNAICRKPKHCEKPTCRLSTYYADLKDILNVGDNIILKAGEDRTLNCKEPSTDTINAYCGSRGQIVPHSSLVVCNVPLDEGNETEVVLPDNQNIRKSCDDCFDGGTASCEAEDDGYVCNCKTGWTKFTCWKAPNFCTKDSCEHGECVSLIDKYSCICYEGYGGSRCEILKNKRESLFSTNELIALASGGVTSATFLQKFIKFRIVSGDVGEDPQEVYIGLRSLAFTIGTTMLSFFGHPQVMNIDPAGCRFYNWLTYFCFLLCQTMILNEAINMCTTMNGINRNEWQYDIKKQKKSWLSYKMRIGLPFLFTAISICFIFASSWDHIPSTWTCVGVYTEGRTSIWLPYLYLNIMCLVGSLCFAECAVHILKHSPTGLLNSYHYYDMINPLCGDKIRKVVRNLPFVFINPILIFFYFLFFSLDAHDPNKYISWLYLVTSCLYNVSVIAQLILTSPAVYDLVLQFLMRFFSFSWFPSHTPVTFLTKNELEERARHKKSEDLPYNHPASPCYIPQEIRHIVKRRLTISYIKHRLEESLSPEDAVYKVIGEEIKNDFIFSSIPESKHMEDIVRTWANSMLKKDTITLDTLRDPTKLTNERFHCRALEALRYGEDYKRTSTATHTKTELHHILKVLSYRPLITGPFIKLPYNLGNRPCQMYFTLKPAPRTRYELPSMRLKFEQALSKASEPYESSNDSTSPDEQQIVEPEPFLDSSQPGFIGPLVKSDIRNIPGARKYLELEAFEQYGKEELSRLEDHADYFESIKING